MSELAVRVINHLFLAGKRVMFITHNSNKRRADFVKELELKNVNFGARSNEEKLSMMISSGYTTACYLKAQKLRRPFVLTSDLGLLQELSEAGITDFVATIDERGDTLPDFESAFMRAKELPELIEGRPVDSVVVGSDMGLTARKVALAINYIKRHEDLHGEEPGYTPMPLIAASGDAGGVLGTSTQGERVLKVPTIGNGAMADVIARAFDPPLPWVDMGTPSDALLDQLSTAYAVDMPRSLMVGDTLQTDIVFGNRGGMQTLLVLSGVTSEEECDHALSSTDLLWQPTFVLPMLGSLAEEVAAEEGEGASCNRGAHEPTPAPS